MPRKRTARSSPVSQRRRSTNGGARARTAMAAPYTRDARWATPARPRNDVFVVDIADRYLPAATTSDDDPLLLTA